jgi:hypothetical protein
VGLLVGAGARHGVLQVGCLLVGRLGRADSHMRGGLGGGSAILLVVLGWVGLVRGCRRIFSIDVSVLYM